MVTIEREQEVSQIASFPAAHPTLAVKQVKTKDKKGEIRDKKTRQLKKVEKMIERQQKKESKQPREKLCRQWRSRRGGLLDLIIT